MARKKKRNKQLEKVYTTALNENKISKSKFNKFMTELNPDFNPKTHTLMSIPKKPPKKTFVESYMARQKDKVLNKEADAKKKAADAWEAKMQADIAAKRKAMKADAAAAKRKAEVARLKKGQQLTKPVRKPRVVTSKAKPMPKVTSKEKKPAFKQLKTKIDEKDRKTSLRAAINAGHLYYWKNGKKMAAVSSDMLKKSGGMSLRTFMNMQEKKKRIRGKTPLYITTAKPPQSLHRPGKDALRSHKKITKVASRKT